MICICSLDNNYIFIHLFNCFFEKNGRTALHVAADNGHSEVVDVLLEFNAGADTETIVSFIDKLEK